MDGRGAWAAMRPFLLAAGLVGIAALLRVWPLGSLGTELLWMTFYLAVMVSAVVGGLWVGEFAVGLSIIVAIFLGPLLVGQAFVSTGPQKMGLVVFAVTASLISVVAELMRRERAKAVRAVAAQTEAEASEIAVRAVTAQLELAQLIAHIGSWSLDLGSGRITWSRELYRIYGRDPADGVPDYEEQGQFLTPESWLRMRTAITETQETGVPFELELEMIRADGTHGWILSRGELVRDAAGAIIGLSGVVQDITGRRTAQELVAQQTDRLELVLESSGLGVWDWNMVTGEVEFDERWAQIVGYRLEELEPYSIETWTRLSHPDDLLASTAAVDAHVRGLTPFYALEFRMLHRDGHWVWVRDRGKIVGWTGDGRPLRMIGTHEDITERKAAESDLRASQAQLEQAHRIAHVGSWELDLATGHTTWSEELFLMQGLDPAGPVPDLADRDRLLSDASWQNLNAAIAAAAKTGEPYELELEMARSDGSPGWMLARGEAVRDADGVIVGLRGATMDVTQATLARLRLEELATQDTLTGLANRSAVLGEIERALSAGRRSGQPTGVLLIDLDRFKDVNDTLGHAAGDALLVAVARRLKIVVRAGDLVARLGGDEFVVAMRGLDDPTGATRAAERLVEAFRVPFTLGETEVYATASVGVAISTGSTDASDMIREADTAMYAAKEAGRDRMSVFNEDLRAAVKARRTIEGDLRQALKRSQLAVWYQPEVDLATGRVVAVEALLRWHHPDGTVWTADRFIDVAEDTGLILDIGDWVLRQATAQGATWAAARRDRPIIVAVNTSALQLAENGLLESIDGALTTSGLDPALLRIEITETALLRQTTTVAANLNGIHERGVALAIDDFGTGYASLTYLSRYPIDGLKIDRSFITDPTSPRHEDEHQLIAGIIALAATLGITVTAEGVEHSQQADHLRKMGCPTAQGWLYSKAVPAEDATPLLDHAGPWRLTHGAVPE